jgi:hypothetical protein
VTPPFAGYVSGHSTYSRAAAEVLTLLTGDEYFPGGMGVFDAPKNEYLVFEDGPSVDMELQWAKYRDASDQASLSRLWGGIHPPIDDVPGRHLGMKIGPQAFFKAQEFFRGESTSTKASSNYDQVVSVMQNYPNPVATETVFEYSVRNASNIVIHIYDLNGRLVESIQEGHKVPGIYTRLWSRNQGVLQDGTYFYRLQAKQGFSLPRKLVLVQE